MGKVTGLNRRENLVNKRVVAGVLVGALVLLAGGVLVRMLLV